MTKITKIPLTEGFMENEPGMDYECECTGEGDIHNVTSNHEWESISVYRTKNYTPWHAYPIVNKNCPYLKGEIIAETENMVLVRDEANKASS